MTVLSVIGIVLLTVAVTAIPILLWVERKLQPLKLEGQADVAPPPGYIRTISGDLVSIDEAMPRP
jgi:hypothetical protein